MKSLNAMFAAVTAVSALLYACGGPPKKPEEPAVTEVVTDAGAEEEAPAAPATAFEKLGKREGIQAIVDSFLKNATVDPAAKGLFTKWKGDRIETLKATLVDHLCKGTGGECAPPEATGAAMKISDKQFDALKADLKAAMDEAKVTEENQAELTKAFEGLREPLTIVLNQKK